MLKFVVFIPMYNAVGTIIDTLNGIGQSAEVYGDTIIVWIADDCSKDDSYNVVEGFSHPSLEIKKWKNDANLGERGTINYYFDKMKGDFDWVFLIHADDVPKPEWIPEFVKVIQECEKSKIFTIWSSYDDLIHPEMRIIPGDNEGSVVIYSRTQADAKKYLRQVGSSYHVSGCAINLELFRAIGGFDSSLPQYGDSDFFVRGILSGFNDIYIRKTLTFYRVIQTSVSFISKKTNRDINEMLYLVKKYSSFLVRNDKLHIVGRAVQISLKRIIKSIYLFDLDAFYSSVKCFIKSVLLVFKNIK